MVRTRLAAATAVVLILGLAFGIRAFSDGWLEQYSGTALYASMIYAGVFLFWPSWPPVRAGLFAVGFCWGLEFFQLTGIPAALSERSLLARLVLGMQFDWVDVAWYPVGVVPLVVLHLLVTRRAAHSAASVGPGSRAGRPAA
jgi:hypothetical protein